jgi:zeaxanthin glucosyltransferase
MCHFGVLCPDLSGHLNPMMALARELERRGHRVTFYQRLIAKTKIEAAGFDFRSFGEREFTIERTRAELKQLAELTGVKALHFTVGLIRRRTVACLRDVPAAARADGITALLVDQVSPEGATIAQELGVPFVTVCNAMMLHRDPMIPPFFTTWKYSRSPLAMLRNRLAYTLIARVTRPAVEPVNQYRRRLGLRVYNEFQDAHSPLLQLCQQPAEFEYPRTTLPRVFHFTGPLVDANVRERSNFPFDKLDGRPLIYASMGTLQNRQGEIFGCIAEACAGLPAQLVISLGGGASVDEMGRLPGDPIVVPFAPQLELLKRAALCITHAGLNTALECLSQGVPMVAIPITNDQPGVAARIAWTGTGELVPPRKLTPARLRAAVERVMSNASYRTAAQRLQQAISRHGGPRQAADLIEGVLKIPVK